MSCLLQKLFSPEGSDLEAGILETSFWLGEEALGQWKRKLGPDGEAGLRRTQLLSRVSIRFAYVSQLLFPHISLESHSILLHLHTFTIFTGHVRLGNAAFTNSPR